MSAFGVRLLLNLRALADQQPESRPLKPTVRELTNSRDKPYRLEVRNKDEKTWRFLVEFDDNQVDRYNEIVNKINRRGGGELVFQIVSNGAPG